MDSTFSLIFTDLIFPILSTLILSGIGILGAWLSTTIKKQRGLETIATATDAVIQAATITAGELQQTLVSKFKEANADNKLTQQEIEAIGKELITKTHEKLATPVVTTLQAANSDITAIIKGAAEHYITNLKKNQ